MHYLEVKSQKGFTLIELLVVISIIGLLSSVVLVSTILSREKARITAGLEQDHNYVASFGSEAIGIWQLGAGSGTSVGNAGGSGTNVGTIANGTWVANSGPDGKYSLNFNGVSAQVALGSVTATQNITITAWIKTTATGIMDIYSNRNVSSKGIFFGVNGGKLFIFDADGTPQQMSSNVSINDNKWHFVVWTSDGTNSKMYIDAKQDSGIVITRTGGQTNNAFIGVDAPYGPGAWFNGNISEVSVYTAALTSMQVQGLYARGNLLAFNK